MVIRYFKSPGFIQIIIVLIISLILWLPSFVNPSLLTRGTNISIIYNFAYNHIKDYYLLNVIFGYLILIFNALVLNNIYSNNGVLPKNNYLIALFYIILMSYSNILTNLNPILLSNTFIIISLYNINKVIEEKYHFQQVLNSAILISLSSMIFFPTIIFILLIWITLIIYRIFSWHEWTISLIGIITPYFFCFTFFYLNGTLINYYNIYLSYFISFSSARLNMDYQYSYYLYWILILIISLISFSNFIFSIREKVVSIRQHSQVVIWFLLICTPLMFFIDNNFIFGGIIVIIPISIIIAKYFSISKKNLLKELLFFGICIMIIIVRLSK